MRPLVQYNARFYVRVSRSMPEKQFTVSGKRMFSVGLFSPVYPGLEVVQPEHSIYKVLFF